MRRSVPPHPHPLPLRRAPRMAKRLVGVALLTLAALATPVAEGAEGETAPPSATAETYARPRMSPKTVTLMIEAVRSGDEDARLRAAYALGEAGVSTDDALRALAALARAGDPPLRLAAATALGRIGVPAAGPALKALLTDPAPSVRRAAATGVGAALSLKTAPALPLDDPEPSVRLAAARAVETMATRSAPPEAARRWAARVSRGLGKEAEPNIRAAGLRALAALGTAPASVLRSALDDSDAQVRAAACAAAGADAEAAAAMEKRLLSLLRDGAATVRRAALDASRLRGLKAAAPEAKRLLEEDPDATVRRAAAAALGALGADEANAALAEAWTDPSRFVRRSASAALAGRADRSADARASILRLARQAAAEGAPPVRREGAWLLGRLRDAEGLRERIAALPAALPAEGVTLDVARILAWGAAEAQVDAAGERLLAFYAAPDADAALRIHAARALGRIGHAPAAPVLAKAALKTKVVMQEKMYTLQGPVRTATLEALVALGGEEALRAITKIATTSAPTESEKHLPLLLEALVGAKYEAAAPRLASVAKMDRSFSYRHRTLAADAAAALGAERPEVKGSAMGSGYDIFFLEPLD